MKNLNESLNYHDLVNQVRPILSVDEYSAKMGEDSEIVTLAFSVKSELAGNDLADWFERGYDYVLDAQVSEGEVSPRNYLVFVEMNRRTSVPDRIVELLTDLETLTNVPLEDWTVEINDEELAPDAESIKLAIPLSPHEYREQNPEDETAEEGELNEMRERAGLEPAKLFDSQDESIKSFKAMAGL